MPFWSLLALAYLAIAGLLIAAFGADWETGVSLLILTGTVLPAIIRHSPRLYLAVQRARYYIANTETTWELALQFRGAIDHVKVDAFVNSLLMADPKGTVLLQSSTDRRLKGAWFGEMRAANLSSTAVFGTRVDRSAEFRRAEQQGRLHTLNIHHTHNGIDYLLMVTTSGVVVTYHSFDTEEEELAVVLDFKRNHLDACWSM